MNEPFFINVEMKAHARLCSEWNEYRERYESVLDASRHADQEWRRTYEETLTNLRASMTAHETLRQGLHEALELDTTLSDADLLARLREALVKPEPLTLVDRRPTCWCGARMAYDQIDVTTTEYWARTGGRKFIDGMPYCTADAGHNVNQPPQIIPSNCWCGAPVNVSDPWPPVTSYDSRSERVRGSRQFECSADGSHNPLQPPDEPKTETMPPVVEPPSVPHPYLLGRRFVRGDIVPEGVTELVEPLGQLWTVEPETGPDPSGFRLYGREGHDARFPAATLLHMKGTLWELIDPRAGEPLVDDNGEDVPVAGNGPQHITVAAYSDEDDEQEVRDGD